MKYKKFFFSISIISIIAINLNISSDNSTNMSTVRLSQIAFASDGEGGSGDSNFKKCGQGKVSFTPAHGATACIYCGDCLAHWVFLTYDGECKLF